MSHLGLFTGISPHSSELHGLVPRIHIVEDCEFGTKEVGEVSDFDVSYVEGDEILVMPDHSSQPLIVGPSSESRH